MAPRDRPYRAFLLRCWQEPAPTDERPSSWRFQIEEVGGGRARRGFANADDLIAFLESQMGPTSKKEDTE